MDGSSELLLVSYDAFYIIYFSDVLLKPTRRSLSLRCVPSQPDVIPRDWVIPELFSDTYGLLGAIRQSRAPPAIGFFCSPGVSLPDSRLGFLSRCRYLNLVLQNFMLFFIFFLSLLIILSITKKTMRFSPKIQIYYYYFFT